MAKKKRPALSKEQIKQIRTSTLHALESSYPGIVAFQHKKIMALNIAFILRVALNILIAMLGVVVAGEPVAAVSIVSSLFIAWLFYVAMVNSGWQGCLLILVWGLFSLMDSLPILLDFTSYYLWAVALFAFEFLCSIAFFAVGGWLCFSKKSRTYATVYTNAVKQATVAEQQNMESQNSWR